VSFWSGVPNNTVGVWQRAKSKCQERKLMFEVGALSNYTDCWHVYSVVSKDLTK